MGHRVPPCDPNLSQPTSNHCSLRLTRSVRRRAATAKRAYWTSRFCPDSVSDLRDDVPVLLLILWKILMPLASWLSRAYVPMWLHSRVTRIARVRRTRLIRFARLATVGVFRIASFRPNGHREILQFFPNQTQFVDDLFSYLIFHIGPLHILHRPGATIRSGARQGF
jgi:hypothetical protein